MGPRLRVKEAVYDDLDEACTWYERRQPGVSARFRLNVDQCIERICATPNAYAKGHLDYRRALVDKFPYTVFYQYDGREVLICAVFHTSRDIAALRRRLTQ